MLTNIAHRNHVWPNDWNEVWSSIDFPKVAAAFGEGLGWGAASAVFGPYLVSDSKWQALSRAGVSAATSFIQDTSKFLVEGTYKTWDEYWANAVFNATKSFMITGSLNGVFPVNESAPPDAQLIAQFVTKVFMGGPLGIYTNLIKDTVLGDR
ncbi:MAG: hypothetical protein ACRC2T_05435 [Thermoguttaceae bacterium]